MVFKHHSTEVKLLAICALKNGDDIDSVEHRFGISRRSLERWQQQLEETHTLARQKSETACRPWTILPPLLQVLRDLLNESPALYLDELADYFSIVHDEDIPISTIADSLRELGYQCKVLQRVAAQRDNILRAQWMQLIQRNSEARQMVFTDESSKDGHTLARRYGHAPHGHCAAEEFFDFVLNELLPKMNRFLEENSVLIMDNCCIHKSQAVAQACEDASKMESCSPVFHTAHMADLLRNIWAVARRGNAKPQGNCPEALVMSFIFYILLSNV
ncbi:hypothetical protein GGX14DRAFT_362772 [Mycena pura]|uniref:Tc1-like transposase DDE domain-containing protein n=1 Tax=Mycena pura TaxID=153505 RepID=A0AAD6VFL0_9AGAR|nr:hypothetical protein GGX14DRAFT_362772 [Mycena pura]